LYFSNLYFSFGSVYSKEVQRLIFEKFFCDVLNGSFIAAFWINLILFLLFVIPGLDLRDFFSNGIFFSRDYSCLVCYSEIGAFLESGVDACLFDWVLSNRYVVCGGM